MSTAPHDYVRGRWLFGVRARGSSPAPAARGIATIELAVVIAVTLLMVALAVSAYRTYSARQEVRAALAAVAEMQALVTHTFDRTGVPPFSERDTPALASPPHRYIETVAIERGRIAIRFGSDADERLRGRSLYLTPFETVDGEVSWLCGNQPADVGLYPLGLFGGTAPPAQLSTTVEPRYLPVECR